MLCILPASFLILTAVALWARGGTVREALLDGAVATGLVLTAITEVSSLLHAFRPLPVAAAWGLAVLAAGRACRRRYPGPRRPELAAFGAWDVAVLLVLVFIGSSTLAAGLFSAPTNWDSMTYHLARVAHWVSDGAVRHYPTSIPRQLYQPPWAEYALAHAQLLSGGDRIAPLVQWLALLGSMVGVSLITQHLGGSRRAQLLSAAVAGTLPMAVVQASSTQNDLVTAFWVVATAVAVLRLPDAADPTRRWLSLGGAVGLGLLTKGTSYLFIFPLLLWLGIRLGVARRRPRFGLAALAVALVVSLNAGAWARNTRTYGSPLGPLCEGETRYLNETVTARAAVAGTIRNLALHLGSRDSAATQATTQRVRELLRGLGADPDDPTTTWSGATFGVPDLSTHEDNAGNRVHLWLYGATLPIVLLLCAAAGRWPALARSGWRRTAAWAGLGLGAFVLFSAALKWQPWNSRLQLPLFILFAPVAARVVAAIPWRGASALAAAGLLWAVLPWALSNKTRPVWPDATLTDVASVFRAERDDQYFVGRARQRRWVQRAAQCIQQVRCEQIGLLAGDDDWEYPLWVMVGRGLKGRRIEHLEVRNVSAALARPNGDFAPCAIVALDRTPGSVGTLTRKDDCSTGRASVYLR